MTDSDQHKQDNASSSSSSSNNHDDISNLPPLHHRFIRINPRFDKEETLRLLKQELDADTSHTAVYKQGDYSGEQGGYSVYPRQVTWLSRGGDFYALPANFALVQSKVYQEGRVYGQDVSSGAAVEVLLQSCSPVNGPKQAQQSSRVRILDVCCAPGQKLMALADGIMSHQNKNDAVVVGVDVSADRLAVCRKAICKYLTPAMLQQQQQQQDNDSALLPLPPRIRLYHADGTTFGQGATDCAHLVWDSHVAQQDTATGRKRLNKSARKRQAQQLQAVADWDWNHSTSSSSPPPPPPTDSKESSSHHHDHNNTLTMIQPFDVVLVDAECSTDGSIKHVMKRRRLEWTDDRLPDLVDLQRRLAKRGFELLKPGATMVYATCSLSTNQNEGVVDWLLKEMGPKAELVAISFPNAPPSVRAGSIPGTLRFWPSQDPKELTGGGFFLAKIMKKE